MSRKIDKTHCLICQKKGKRNLVKTPNLAVLDRILVECESVAVKETFVDETGHSLYSNGYSYHSDAKSDQSNYTMLYSLSPMLGNSTH